jgi:hypothetical protein
MKKIDLVLEKVKNNLQNLKDSKGCFLSEYEQGCEDGRIDILSDLIEEIESIKKGVK